jgi:hypothetical protein
MYIYTFPHCSLEIVFPHEAEVSTTLAALAPASQHGYPSILSFSLPQTSLFSVSDLDDGFVKDQSWKTQCAQTLFIVVFFVSSSYLRMFSEKCYPALVNVIYLPNA